MSGRAFDGTVRGNRISAPTVPAGIAVTEPVSLLSYAYGTGYQIYSLGSESLWHVVRPEATLEAPDEDNVEGFITVGHHFGTPNGDGTLSPTWQQTYDPTDDSAVVGKKLAQADAPDPTHDIPWLKVQVVSHSGSGPANGGTGLLAEVMYIQRVATQGGLMPSSVPDWATPDTQVWVPYSAWYYFWGAIYSATGGL